jgi:WD40 repeat protein
MPFKKLKPVSRDGKYGLSWGSDGVVGIVDIRTGDSLWWLLDNHPVWILRAAFSRDMRRILCLNWGGTVGIWRIAPGRRCPPAQDIVQAACHGEYDFTLRSAHLREL